MLYPFIKGEDAIDPRLIETIFLTLNDWILRCNALHKTM